LILTIVGIGIPDGCFVVQGGCGCGDLKMADFRVPPASRGNRVGAPLAVPLAKRGEPKGGGISEPCNTHRAGKVHKLLRVQNPPTPCPLLIRVQRFGKESLRQGRFFPAHARGQARSFALTPCVPLSRRRERGNALQGALPCAPTPSPTRWERGRG
jgi:hypothetical protein